MLRTLTSTTQRAHTSSRSSETLRLPGPFVRYGSSHEDGGSRPETSASTKLWQDAVEEEADETGKPSKPATHPNEYPNWTGEESVQDAVLRMLVDKYKPLRGGSIRTAEEKIKSAPPGLGPLEPPLLSLSPESSSLAASTSTVTDTVNPDTHKPWLTTFRAPSHATSVRYMRLPPSPSLSGARAQGPPIHPDDSRSRSEQREKRRKAAYAGRLTNARESSLDYRIGKIATAPGDPRMHRANPVGIKGWTSLVEERIEVRRPSKILAYGLNTFTLQRARNEGYFRSVKGRGKPIAREIEQSNPFIPREEFLMNRIVQRQGAAPPWVEIQGGKPAARRSHIRGHSAIMKGGTS
jgi:DnaJ family protein C protein 28